MLLAIDVGNTQTVLGLYDGETLNDHWRVATESHRSGDEIGALIEALLPDLNEVDGVCLSSTVPALVRSYDEFVRRSTSARLLVLGPGVRTGVPVRSDDPREVGPDRIADAAGGEKRHRGGGAPPRIANARGAKSRYGVPAIVVDFGTSTNFDVVSAEGEWLGGVLAPGIEISMDALFARAARLFRVEFTEPPSVIGKTTVASLQSGLVYGFTGQVDEIVTRIRAELDGEAHVVATGGLADLIAPHSKTIQKVDPWLTLEGLRLVWELDDAAS